MQVSRLSRRQALLTWALCCVLAGGVFLVYALTSLAMGRGQYVMPLDDVYIHFQYAKQMALGQPYVYNPGQPPTSGATSFLYPFILAFGYLIGFTGLNLGVWALGAGALALACSAWLMVLLTRALNAPHWLALVGAAVFTVSGPISWHFMSGMETGLAILFTLLILYQFVRQDARGVGIAGALLALTRPEGGILALIAVILFVIPSRIYFASNVALNAAPLRFKLNSESRWLLLPLLALGVQPFVNLLFTGSMVATGNQAKSIFGMIPFYWDVVLARIIENFLRMWTEFATGISPREGWYLPLGVSLLALIGWLRLLWQHDTRRVGLLVIAWLLAGTGAISTLDPAFWHFKRYQMPLLALLFLLAVWGAVGILNRKGAENAKLKVNSTFHFLLSLILLGTSLWTGGNFLRFYLLNVDYVYSQPLQMARWLEANTPPDATVAVHDVGMMRYIGSRTTLDMVGLTTAGAADAWRNGPGAVAEFLIDARPDYIAAYTDARGLGYLADTGLYNYRQALVEFPVTVDMSANVALAAETPLVVQGIYQPQWEHLDNMDLAYSLHFLPRDFSNLLYGGEGGFYSINVGDLASEREVDYRWSNAERLSGFATEVYENSYLLCPETLCVAPLDGGRLINGEESFNLHLMGQPTQGAVLLTRVHPLNAGTFDVYLNDVLLGTRWIPAIPGHWLDIATYLPPELLADPQPQRIRIVPRIPNGYYMPYSHRVYAAPEAQFFTGEPLISYQSGRVLLMESSLQVENSQLNTNLTWQTPGSAQGDYIIFIHVYADVHQSPIAQTDMRPGGGTLPQGNWLPGVLRDTMTVDLTDVSPGHYQVAIGMYDAVTLQNLHPDFGGDELGRIFIGTIDIPEN